MSIWPVEGGPEQWPVYRGSAAHVAACQGPGCDLGNQLGLPWIAVGDGVLVSHGHNDVEAGWFCDLHFTLGGSVWQLRYCHGGEQPHPETDEEWTAGGVTARWPVKKGDVIGHVGYSGNVVPSGPAGAHLHNACWLDGVRVVPEVLYALLQEEPTPAPEPPEEEPMTEYEVGELNEAWEAAETMEQKAATLETEARWTREWAKAIKNAVRMAKGEAVEG